MPSTVPTDTATVISMARMSITIENFYYPQAGRHINLALTYKF